MSITVLPPQKNAYDYAEPYLQFAFQAMMQKQLQDQQRQENMQRANQMFPGLFTNQAQQTLASERPDMGVLGTMPESYKKILQKESKTQPLQFNIENASKYPGIGMDLFTGNLEYKVPQPQMPMFGILPGQQTGLAKTAEEAINNYVTQTGENPKNIIATPKPLPGGKGIAYFEASVKPEVQKSRESAATVSTEKVQMGSALDSMYKSLNDMETVLTKDPNILLRNMNPFSEREFKAILSNYDKTAAIAAGGKQLTATELNLIRETRPTWLDYNNPKAIAYKIQKQKEIIANAQSRLAGQQPMQTQQQGEDFSSMSDEELRRIASGG